MDRIFVGTPEDWFHNLDLLNHPDWTKVRPDLEMSVEEMFSKGCKALVAMSVALRDQLQLLMHNMGTDGAHLKLEERVLVAFHSQGEVLPPRVDSPGTARRLTLMVHFS